MARRRFLASSILALGAWTCSSCAPSGFTDATVINSVRILASSAEPPYVAPGNPSTVRVLAFDGRPKAHQAEPMRLTWLPLVCINPPNDAYYACFPQFAAALGALPLDGGSPGNGAGAADGSADGGAGDDGGVPEAGDGGGLSEGGDDGGAPEAGDDGSPGATDASDDGGLPGPPTGGPVLLSTSLPCDGGVCPPCNGESTCQATFTMPANALQPRKGVTHDYGLAILFNVACAGRVGLVPPDPNNVQSPPFGCFGPDGGLSSPDDYVLGFTRVYSYDPTFTTNKNPVIDDIHISGFDLPDAGADCGPQGPGGGQLDTKLLLNPDGTLSGDDGGLTQVTVFRQGNHCSRTLHIGPEVPTSSQEPNPAQLDVNMHPVSEQITAEFYSTLGSFKSGARLLYDPSSGSVGDTSVTDNDFTPPSDPGTGTIWIVVRDNRGGATWAIIPVTVL